MSTDWYLIDSRSFYTSGYERREHFDWAYDGFNEILDTTALGENVILYQNGSLDESTAVHTKAVVQGNTAVRQTQYDSRQILSNIGTLKLGNYVGYKGDIYLITELPGDNQVYEKAWMQYCNYNLRWVNDEGEVVERMCVVKDSTRYSSGEAENYYLVVGNMRMEIFVPKDFETLRIKRDQRFIIDDYDHAQYNEPLVYSITKANLVQKSKNGQAVFMFIIAEDAFNAAKDNRELMIADYYNRFFQDGGGNPVPQPGCLISYTGNPELRVGGAAKVFTANFYDSAGDSISDTATWSLYDSSTPLPAYITVVSETADSIRLRCENDFSLVGQVVYLKLVDSNGAEDVLEVKLISLT